MNNYRANEMLQVNMLLRKEFEIFNSINENIANNLRIFNILNRKIKDRSLRAYFSCKVYQYLKKFSRSDRISEIFFIWQLPFILEVIISVQYYHNQILDAKGGINTREKVNDNLILGNLLKEHLYRYLEYTDLSDRNKLKLIEHVRLIFEYVDIGQYVEKHCNTYESLKANDYKNPFESKISEFIESNYIDESMDIIQGVYPIKEEHHAFLACYLGRIYLTNAALFKISTQLICELLEIEEAKTLEVIRFAVFFGLMQQIVNDNCDFVPSKYNDGTKAKNNNDGLSDLRNRCITLPLLIHLQNCPNSAIERYLSLDNYAFDENYFFREITGTWSIYYSMTVAKEIKKKLIDEFTQREKEVNEGLINLWSVADNNRFYKHFYKFNNKKCYKEYKKEKDNRT